MSLSAHLPWRRLEDQTEMQTHSSPTGRSTRSNLLSTAFAVQFTIIVLRASEMSSTWLTSPHISHLEVHNIPDHLPHSLLSFLAAINKHSGSKTLFSRITTKKELRSVVVLLFTSSRERTGLTVSNQLTHKPKQLVIKSSQCPYWCSLW